MPSSSNLAALSDISTLRKRCQSLAMLDAILSPQWESRYFSFNKSWGDGSLASMRDGEGDEWIIGFLPFGALIKGFAHESPMSPFQHQPPRRWPGVMDDVPREFAEFLGDAALEAEVATFCLWRLSDQNQWQRGSVELPPGDDPDGSRELLAWLDGAPQTYRDWAQEYFERDVDLEAVSEIYRHKLLEQTLVHRLNPELSLDELEEDRQEIGYSSTELS